MRVIRAALSGCCVASLRGLSEDWMLRAGLAQSGYQNQGGGTKWGTAEKLILKNLYFMRVSRDDSIDASK